MMTNIRNLFLVFLLFETGFLIAFANKRSNYKKFSSETILNTEYNRIQKLAEGVNNIVHFPLATASNKSGILLSPDVLFSAVCYDLSEKPLGLFIPIPESDWTISFYDEKSNNYYTLDNRFYRSNNLQVALVKDNQPVEIKNEEVKIVRSPGSKGIIIVRYLVSSPQREKDLANLRNEMKSGQLKLENI